MNRAASVIGVEVGPRAAASQRTSTGGAEWKNLTPSYARGRYCQARLHGGISLYRNTIFSRLDNPRPLRVVEMSRGKVRRASVVSYSIVSHAQQFQDEDEDKAVRIACYLICAIVTGRTRRAVWRLRRNQRGLILSLS